VTSDETAPCPFCAELIHPAALKCRHCRTFLREPGPPRPSPEELGKLGEALKRLASDTREPDLAGQPRKFGPAAPVMLVLTAASVAPAFIWKHDAPMAVGVFGGLVFGVTFLVLFGIDLVLPSVRGRATPEQGARCFLQSMRYGRWRRAFACLSPLARERVVERRARPELGASANSFCFTEVEQLRMCWGELVRPGGATSRIVRGVSLDVQDPGEGVARANVVLRIETYPMWILLLLLAGVIPLAIAYLIVRREHVLAFPLLLVRHRRQWWVATGDPDSALDGSFVISR